MSKILVIDDEIEIFENIKIILKEHTIKYANNAEEALKILEKEHIDLIILDIMLPVMDGIEFLEKTIYINIPTIAVSGIDDTFIRQKCYKLGIMNFITKPFENNELRAIVEGILNPIKKETKIKYKNIQIDLSKKEVKINTKTVELTPKEYNVFVYLIKHQDIAVSREDILNNVWNDNFEIETRTVDVTIANIRKKLKLKNEIKTVSKVGYLLEKIR